MKTITDEMQLEALEESMERHLDGVKCTEKNYLKFEMDERSCACCNLFGFTAHCDCNYYGVMCPLFNKSITGYPCCDEFYEAINARIAHDFPAFHAAEIKLVERIEREIAIVKKRIAEAASIDGKIRTADQPTRKRGEKR